jgi:hypothetical protein
MMMERRLGQIANVFADDAEESCDASADAVVRRFWSTTRSRRSEPSLRSGPRTGPLARSSASKVVVVDMWVWAEARGRVIPTQ